MTPYQKAGFNELSLLQVQETDDRAARHGRILWLKRDDATRNPIFSGTEDDTQVYTLSDLKELPKDADGFYLWEGGKCPVPGDWEVVVKIRNGNMPENVSLARNWHWGHTNEVDDITAFKPISRPDMPSVAQSATGQARYTDAMLRHWAEEAAGVSCDKDTNLRHAAHLAWNALARLELALIEAEALEQQEGEQ